MFFGRRRLRNGFGHFLDWRHRRFVLLLGNQLALVLRAFLVWIAPAEVGPLEIWMCFLTCLIVSTYLPPHQAESVCAPKP